MTRIFLFIMSSLLFWSCSTSKEIQQAATADDISVAWVLNENNYKGEFNYSNSLIIKNTSSSAVLSTGWEIYFSQLPKKIIEAPTNVSLTHINGDFYRIAPTDSTPILQPGDSIIINYVCNDWVIKKIDAPCGFYIVLNGEAKTIANISIGELVSDKQTKRFSGDVMPVTTPESRFEAFATLKEIEKKDLPPIVPTPNSFKWGDGIFVLSKNTTIKAVAELKQEQDYLIKTIAKEFPTKSVTTENSIISLQLNTKLSKDEYTLNITNSTVAIVGGSNSGVFYGIQSLIALIPTNAIRNTNETIEIPSISIKDKPRFGYRGMHLDVGRNFQSKASVLKLLDYMAFYKLNSFHFHLTDDEGWRIEIPTLPELTEIGAFRGHTLTEKDHLMPAYGSGPDRNKSTGSGFYSKADYIEILKYAKERHIEIIPEFDLPGHARAAIKAMDVRYDRFMAQGKKEEAEKYLLRDLDDKSEYRSVQLYNDNVLCVCRPSVYTFIETVVNDLVSIYKEAGHPLNTIHIGADEVPNGVWEKSPICDEFKKGNGLKSKADLTYYFLKQYNTILKKNNLKMGGWEEIGMIEGETAGSHVVNKAMASQNTQPYVWNNVWGWGMEDFAYKLANTGYKVVLSNATNLYFDLAYNKDPNENGYYWAGFCDARKTYEFTPMDIFKSAYEDRMGNKLDDTLWTNKTRLTKEGAKNILGIQGQLWSETVRTPQDLEYYLFPKLIGLAERAWAEQPAWATIENKEERLLQLDNAWIIFANQLGQIELQRANKLFGGVNYRVAKGEKNGDVNYEFPGYKK